jgi:hypothetical protein
VPENQIQELVEIFWVFLEDFQWAYSISLVLLVPLAVMDLLHERLGDVSVLVL